MVKTPPQKIAVLIDADNLQSDLLDNMLKAVEKHGKPMIRRAYGDWTNDSLNRWHLPAKNNSFELIQVTQNSINKNATDIGLVIDAMDIMFQGKMDGFCIVSNDSDFTSLCTRLRNAGLFVMGIGGKHASPTLRKACEEWVFIHDIQPSNYKKRRNTSFRPGKRRNRSTTKANNTTPLESLSDRTPPETNESRWSMITTSLSYLKQRVSSINTSESDTIEKEKTDTLVTPQSAGANKSKWQTQIQKSSPLLNSKSNTSTNRLKALSPANQAKTDSSKIGGSSLRDRIQRPADNETSPSTNDTSGDDWRSRLTASTSQNNSEANNGQSDTNQTDAITPLVDAQATPETINQTATDDAVGQTNKATQPEDHSTQDEQTEEKPKSKKQRSQEIDQWKPFIQDLSDAYIRNLLLAAYCVAHNGEEWVRLDSINSSLLLLNPKFKYKALGYGKLSNLIDTYPQLMTIRKEGQKSKTKYYVKLVHPK